jgi:hypothetical protein
MQNWIAGLKRFGETLGAVIVIATVFSGIVHLTGGSLPPWFTNAAGQAVIQRLDKNDAVQQSIQIELLNADLDRAWTAWDKNHDQNSRDDIVRLTAEIHKIDPTVPLAAPPPPPP